MEPGQIVSHYEIVEKLGEGGMGVVYKAIDTHLDRAVALKFLPRHLGVDEEAKLRFVQEAKAASALDHANICTIHDIAETADGELYIVMAYYEGRTLRERLQDGALPLESAVSVGLQLARALERAHEAGIIHRDLKPANVLVTDRGEVKLLDFGVAKLAESGVDLTNTGTTLGTASYMSPEQVAGEPIDSRADLFSFGAVMYELLSGRKAFDGASQIAVATAVVSADPEPLAATRPDVPGVLAEAIGACLAKDPDERPEDAGDVVRAMESARVVSAVDGVSRRVTKRVAGGIGKARVAHVWKKPAVRLVPIFAVVAIFGAAAFGVVSSMDWSTASAVPLSDDLHAVMPFSVAGPPELAYLGEGVADLLSTRLTGAGSIRSVDPRAVISAVRSEGVDPGRPEAYDEIAASFGAGHYVTGDIVEVGGNVTVTAYLHDTGRPGDTSEPATVQGATDEVFDLLDGLFVQLMATTMSGDAQRLAQLGAGTSASVEAVKEFLQGEQLLRAGLYREAAEAYNRAVAEDSNFALAWYRKSIAADWVDAFDVRSSADRAFELSGELAPRDRSLLRALQLRRRGEVDEAEAIFRQIVHDYPNDVEAWVQLGEAIFHDTSRRGGSTLDAIEPFSRAVELEPTNVMAQVHVARLYALFDSVEALTRTADFFREFGSDSERALEVEAMYAYLAGDSAQQAAVKQAVVGRPWFYQFFAVHGVSRFARDAEGAADILAAKPAEDPYIMALVPGIAVVRGKYEDAYAYLDEIRGLSDPMWDLLEAFLMTSKALPLDRDRAASLAARLARATGEAIHRRSFLPPYEDLTPAVAAFHRDYFLALLYLDLGREEEARVMLDRMRLADDFPYLGSLKPDAIRSLESEFQLVADDREGALTTLRGMEVEVPHAATVWPLADMGRARFLRAELERELGDIEVAKRFYIGLDEPWSPWDSYWRPLLYERLGEISEEQGREDDAIEYYSRLADLWSDADPSLSDRKATVEARLNALLEGRQKGP